MIYNAKEYARLRNVVFAISFVAWMVILFEPHIPSCCAARGSANPWSGINHGASLAVGWMLMLVAMMSPTLIPTFYHIRISSFASRQTRSMMLFIIGYSAVWLIVGGVLLAAELEITCVANGSYLPATVVGLAALIWQASPWKQRCLNRCHSHRPLAAFGIAADRDAFRLGLEHGFWCTGSCWAAMLFPMLLPQGHLLAMAAVSVLMFCERIDPPKSPSWRWRGFGSALRYLSLRLHRPQYGAMPLDADTRA